jgi:hypothetical protein
VKSPNRRQTRTLLALAALLAAMSTGCLSLCELFFGVKPEPGPTVTVTVQAGNNANGFAALAAFLSRFALCDFDVSSESSRYIPAGASTVVPAGVYCRTNRDLRGSEPTATVDLVTSASTPPGQYMLEYRDASPGSYVVGTLNLTIEPGEAPLVQACLYVYGDGEVIVVNQNTNFYGCCSLAPEDDPIVQYKWWFDYNGNPSSAPSATTTLCLTDYTYTTPGPRTTRLVVRTQSGEEAEDTQDIVVLGL